MEKIIKKYPKAKTRTKSYTIVQMQDYIKVHQFKNLYNFVKKFNYELPVVANLQGIVKFTEKEKDVLEDYGLECRFIYR